MVVSSFFLAIMGQIFLPSMGIFFLIQWPIFVFIFILNFFQKGKFPLFLAFLAGVLIDLISGLHFGVFSLSLFSIAMISQAAQARLRGSSPASFLMALVICGLAFFGLTRLFYYIFSII
ncbi:MAG: hypothetical protein V1819_03240 [bacterium]